MPTKQTALPASDLPKIGAPATRALAAVGCFKLKQVSKHTEAELKKLHGVGPTAIERLRQALAAQGMSFAPDKHKK